MDEEYVKKLVVARLSTMPPNVGFSIGAYGDFKRDDLIANVREGTPVGKEFIKIELRMLLDTPKLVGRLSGQATSSH